MKDKIDFICVGMPRAGTTWLFTALKDHPEICIPEQKELRFFNDPRDIFFKTLQGNYGKGKDWYLRKFENCDANVRKGEIGTQYFYDIKALERIKRLFPDVKIIVILRNPIDRLYSEYVKNKDKYNLPKIERVIEIEKDFVDTGLYSKHLQNLWSFFERKQTLTLIFDDIVTSPANALEKVQDFIGVSPQTDENVTRKVNATTNEIYTNKIIGLKRKMSHNQLLRYSIPILRSLGITKLALWVSKKNGAHTRTYEPIPETVREKLLTYYKNDIECVEQLLNRDLSAWKR